MLLQAYVPDLTGPASLAHDPQPRLERVLVTCAEDNPASRAVIQACEGIYEDSRVHTRRSWITTS